ncbi:hypothetical protein SESBI_25558 [Sesbania bispinosa]|nr:hypothetical protein SESBI_25558 [Sesbania bispinosa]
MLCICKSDLVEEILTQFPVPNSALSSLHPSFFWSGRRRGLQRVGRMEEEMQGGGENEEIVGTFLAVLDRQKYNN